MSTLTSRPARVAGAVLVMLLLVGVAVAGQLSARLTGDEYTFRVAPLDPIDPFRGAYVELSYPDLLEPDGADMDDFESDRGELFVPLREEGGVWVASGFSRERPTSGPYLACDDRDWRTRCGIESWFLPQDKALEVQDAVNAGDSRAIVRIDGRGNAALVRVETP